MYRFCFMYYFLPVFYFPMKYLRVTEYFYLWKRIYIKKQGHAKLQQLANATKQRKRPPCLRALCCKRILLETLSVKPESSCTDQIKQRLP